MIDITPPDATSCPPWCTAHSETTDWEAADPFDNPSRTHSLEVHRWEREPATARHGQVAVDLDVRVEAEECYQLDWERREIRHVEGDPQVAVNVAVRDAGRVRELQWEMTAGRARHLALALLRAADRADACGAQ